MLASTHLVIGALSGRVSDKYFLKGHIIWKVLAVFVAGALSHLVLDSVSHEEYNINDQTFLYLFLFGEFILTLYLVHRATCHISRSGRIFMFVGLVGGASFDTFRELYRLFGVYWPWRSGAAQIHDYFHGYFDFFLVTIPVQIIITILALISFTIWKD